MSDIKCTCKWNPDRHDDDCPVFMQEEITTLRARLDEKTTQCVRWAAHAKNLEAQLEQERARVAELEADNQHQRDRRNAARECIKKMGEGSAWLLRKQAEAVTGAYYAILDDLPDAPKFKHCRIVMNALDKHAQRLRQQAYEAEKGGSAAST